MNRPRKHHKELPRNVYFRHGAYYHVRGGKWTRIGKDFKGAMVEYAKIAAEPKTGMASLIDTALPHILRAANDNQGAAKNTEKGYRLAARRLKKALAEFAPEDVKPKHVAALKLRWAKTPAVANQRLTVLRLVFAFAVENQLLDASPVSDIKPFRTAKRTRLVRLEEYVAIYRHAGRRLQVIMDLCIRTGQRISDVLKIRRADLTEEGIRFQAQKTGSRGVVPWTPELRAIVERAKTLDGNIRSLTLLHDRTGKAPSYGTIREQWVKARTAAGIPDARIHDLRAVAATWAKKQGKNPTTLLFHSSAAQTQRYLRDKEESIAEGPSFEGLLDKAAGVLDK
jgi:integrase